MVAQKDFALPPGRSVLLLCIRNFTFDKCINYAEPAIAVAWIAGPGSAEVSIGNIASSSLYINFISWIHY